MPPNDRVAPAMATWTGDPFGIQVPDNCPGRLAGGELPEDPTDELGLGPIDPPATMDRLAPGA
jgi:hypothetical protein